NPSSQTFGHFAFPSEESEMQPRKIARFRFVRKPLYINDLANSRLFIDKSGKRNAIFRFTSWLLMAMFMPKSR
ncbi:hypothetical protein, partial [Pseudomonas aeruginosa]|uniref:hypothetical protein n=1 Tax=Pseudomonas aeruginosa TaxID=287 RepID=UPI001ADC0CF8